MHVRIIKTKHEIPARREFLEFLQLATPFYAIDEGLCDPNLAFRRS